MGDLLRAPIEPETHATCADCAMCKPADSPADPDAHYFNPGVKCCTFLPALPNFLVGRILLEPDPALARGRTSVGARIAAGVGLTPLGLGRSAGQDAHDPGPGFGRDEALLCPHYVREGGTCGIWPHREATCTTFFCKHVRGAVGADFWSALQRLLEAIEQALAWQCLEALDLGTDAVSLLLGPAADSRHGSVAQRQDGTYAPADFRVMWGRWVGRERAFYEAAAGVVESLSWREILERTGPRVRLRAQLVREAHARLQAPAIPAGALRRGLIVATPLAPDSMRLATYRATDPITIPRALFDALPHFDGRAAEPAIAAIEAEQGLTIDPDVVGRLVDFEVLVPVPAEAEGPTGTSQASPG